MQQDSNIAATPVIAIFDIGKTNKKLLLFNRQYQIVLEESSQFPEISDEDGYPCDDLKALTDWVLNRFSQLQSDKSFDVKAVNFSAYGASFVYLNKAHQPVLPLYNYLKPLNEDLLIAFQEKYGGAARLALQTASPNLGNLNSGIQLYRIKQEKPALFPTIEQALHLPQYLSFMLGGGCHSDITSIGCHTQLWDFAQNAYHPWVAAEGIDRLLSPIAPYDSISTNKDGAVIGIGLHDSSAALIPYLVAFTEPFVLLSTGTWCISLHPFNKQPLTSAELDQDCLCYLSFQGNPVKASRLFAGNEHEQQIKKLAQHFGVDQDYYKTVYCNPKLLPEVIEYIEPVDSEASSAMLHQSAFGQRNLNGFESYEAAYHQLIADIITQQVFSTNLVLKGSEVKRIFVDGGFSKNPIYMYLLARAYPDLEVYAASVPQASSIGAAMALHHHWNPQALPADMIDLRLYSIHQGFSL